MTYKIKWWFILKVVAVVVAVGVTVRVVHGWQVQKQVGAYLDQANRAKEAGDEGLEANYLDRYLKANPNDIDARDRLARLLCKTATRPRELENAYYALEDVLRRAPERDDLRRFTVEFATGPKVGLYKEARAHVEVLLAKTQDADLEMIRGKCLLAEQKFADACDAYQKAYELNPSLVDAYAFRAFVLRRDLNRPTDADEAIKIMREKNKGNFRTYLLSAEYWHTFSPADRGVEAATAVAEALLLAPTDRDVLLTAADLQRFRGRDLFREGKYEEAADAGRKARGYLQKCIDLHPATVPAYKALAALEPDPRKALEWIDKGLAAVPDSVELTHEKFDYQFQANDVAGAAATAEKLSAPGALKPEVLRYERARVLVLQKKWTEAAPVLAEVIPHLPPGPNRRRANILLASCYEQLGEHHRRLDALLRAENDPDKLGVDDPLWPVVAAGVADAYAALGRVAAANAAYTRLADRAPAAWAQVARIEIGKALALPPAQRSWAAAEAVLRKAEAAVAEKKILDLTEIRLLRVNLLHHTGDQAGARNILAALQQQRGKEPLVWVESAMQDAREGDLEAALATLDKAAQDPNGPGDGVDLRAARGRLLFEQWRVGGRKDKELAAKVAAQGADAEKKFGAEPAARLYRALYDVTALMGAEAEAGQLLAELARLRPDDLGAHAMRFDRAGRKGDAAGMEQALRDIVRIEGDGGPYARSGHAALLVERSKGTKSADEKKALRDQALAVFARLEAEKVGPPLDARIALAQGLLLDDAGPDHAAAAAEKFQRAYDLGDYSPATLVRLTQLYTKTGQYVRAVEVYKRLPEVVRNDPKLQRLGSVAMLGAGMDPADALALAVKGIPEDKADPPSLLFLSQVYLASGDKAKAEALIRKAIGQRPESPDGHLLLITHLVSEGRRADAEKALEEASGKVGKAEVGQFRAVAFGQLGQHDKALEAFAEADKVRPNHAPTLLGKAEYLLQLGRLAEAREAFKRVMGLADAPPKVRRVAHLRLALATALDPDYRVSSTAPGIVEEAVKGGADPADDPLGQILVLAYQRDRSQRLKALQLLKDRVGERTKAEQFLLVQLYHSVGDRVRGRDELTHLMGPDKKKWLPAHVAYLAQSLLRDGDLASAEPLVALLHETDPDGFATVTLRAKLAVARKDPERAKAVLAAREKGASPPLGALARLYEELGMYEDAERVLNLAIAAAEKKQPAVVLARPAFYGRRDRARDAVRELEAVKGRLPMTDVGGVAVAALYAAKTAGKEEKEKVAGWLAEAVEKASGAERALLQQQLASVKNLQGSHREAVDLYKQVLVASPNDVIALNNLAYLLSSGSDPKFDEALRLIGLAKKQVGDNPDVLDTEAMILLYKGDPLAAADILKGVVAEAPGKVAYYHLALAKWDARDEPRAREAWAEAKKLGLEENDLHPTEREKYKEYATKFR